LNLRHAMLSNTSKVGLVLSGGGAKGAYQVGVMRYLTEAGIAIDAISGASIGALNGAIISNATDLKEAYQHLEHLWQLLSNESPLKFNNASIVPYLGFAMLMGSGRLSPAAMAAKLAFDKLKNLEVFDGLKSPLGEFEGGLLDHSPIRDLINRYTSPDKLNNGLPLYISAYESEGLEVDLLKTIGAAMGISDTKKSDFFHVQSYPLEQQQDIIFASASLPLLFAAQKIDGKSYSDGGLGGWQKSQGNTPITPLIEKENCTHIIVTHLTDGSFWNRYDFPNTTILEVRPKQPISKESMIKDLLGFKAEKIDQWIEQGYIDAKRCISDVKRIIEQQAESKSTIEKRNIAISELDNDGFSLSLFSDH
jgi:NTE family protein